jgi:protein-S-isoprenylcysteine O-methyltransferase Ste14
MATASLGHDGVHPASPCFLFKFHPMNNRGILPPAYLLAALIINIALHFSLPVMILIATPWNSLGVVPLTVGVVMNVMADRKFHRAGITIKPLEIPSRLVTDGIFRISRNPMYLGFVLIVAGESILFGSLMPLIATVLFATLLDRKFVAPEERMLAERFGNEWRTYAATKPRWL